MSTQSPQRSRRSQPHPSTQGPTPFSFLFLSFSLSAIHRAIEQESTGLFSTYSTFLGSTPLSALIRLPPHSFVRNRLLVFGLFQSQCIIYLPATLLPLQPFETDLGPSRQCPCPSYPPSCSYSQPLTQASHHHKHSNQVQPLQIHQIPLDDPLHPLPHRSHKGTSPPPHSQSPQPLKLPAPSDA